MPHTTTHTPIVHPQLPHVIQVLLFVSSICSIRDLGLPVHECVSNTRDSDNIVTIVFEGRLCWVPWASNHTVFSLKLCNGFPLINLEGKSYDQQPLECLTLPGQGNPSRTFAPHIPQTNCTIRNTLSSFSPTCLPQNYIIAQSDWSPSHTKKSKCPGRVALSGKG